MESITPQIQTGEADLEKTLQGWAGKLLKFTWLPNPC